MSGAGSSGLVLIRRRCPCAVLVLSRNPGEEIVINGDIIVRVLAVSGSQVKIGIEAPPEVKIFRREIYDQIAEAVQEASRGTPGELRRALGRDAR